MQNRQLHWGEGLFLRPHHFQSADRFWQELIEVSSKLDNAYNWGIYQAEINQDALDSQIVDIVRFQARSKHGTIVAFDSSLVNKVDLNQKAEKDPRFVEFLREKNGIKVYLGIPHLKLTRRNVSSNGDDGQARFLVSSKQFEDESTGENPQEIEVKDLNVQILFESDNLSGFETIPVFRLVRSKKVDANLAIDKRYYPPCLTTRSFDPLQRNIMEASYDVLNSRADVLRRQIVDAGVSFSTQRAGAVDSLMMLQAINEGLGILNCHSFAEGVHPFTAYTSLCQIIGRLSIFGPDKSNGDMPRYDHENLFEIFWWALHRIRTLIDVGDSGYFQRFFKGAGPEILRKPKMQVALEPEWFGPDWQLILGLHSIDLSIAECFNMLKRKWTFKIGDPVRVDRYYERHSRGVGLGSVRQTPSVLPVSKKWQFFSFKQDDCWDEVKSACSICLRFNADQVVNLAELENHQTITMNDDGQNAAMEFAVFAVKDQR